MGYSPKNKDKELQRDKKSKDLAKSVSICKKECSYICPWFIYFPKCYEFLLGLRYTNPPRLLKLGKISSLPSNTKMMELMVTHIRSTQRGIKQDISNRPPLFLCFKGELCSAWKQRMEIWSISWLKACRPTVIRVWTAKRRWRSWMWP